MAADYWRSSQANHWLLSPYELKLSRLEDIRYAGSEDTVAAVTIWMANAISQLAKRFGLRQRVTATATVLFHRFYAVPPNSYCNTDPCMVATACLYVASKVEETPLHVRSVIVEAARAWTEYGHSSFPTSGTGLAEMEFYLLRDLDYHLILHHPYRPLMAVVGAAGKNALEKSEAEAKIKSVASDAIKGGGIASRGQAGLGTSAEALGVGSSKLGPPSFDMVSLSQAEGNMNGGGAAKHNFEEADRARIEEESARRAMSAGDYGLPVARAEEIDDGVVQMAWFLLNDTYRHPSLHLLFPPYILALAALYLALVLHETSREKMVASVKRMEERRALREEEMKRKDSSDQHQAKNVKREDSTGARGSSDTSDAPTKSVSALASAAISSGSTYSTSRASSNLSNPSASAGSKLPHGLANRPGHLPPRPGAPLSREASSTSSSLNRLPSYQAHGLAGTSSLPLQSPASINHTNSGVTAAAGSGSAGLDQLGLNRMDGETTGPAPPPDVLTFFASLNLSPTHQLAECVQGMLDGYALWGKVMKKIDGAEGSKRVMGWLEKWRRMREEELRVLEMEADAS